jgi:hypothetical protein
MPILPNDVKYYLSGGASNVNPNLSIGGAISTTQFVDNTTVNLFGDVAAPESAAGSTKHRCLYVVNGHATLTMQGASFFLNTNTPAAGDTVNIGLGTAGSNGTEQALQFDYSSPVGVSFSAPTTRATGLNLGNIAPGQSYPIWFQRIVSFGASGYPGDSFAFEVDFDTFP